MPNSSNPVAIADAIALAVHDYPLPVARIYIALGVSLSRVPGIVVNAGSHGFISQELRGYRNGDWCFSLVLNKRWIRLYIRAPELSRGVLLSGQFQCEFPSSEITAKGEIALNISSEDLAKLVCDWMERLPQQT